MLHVGMDMHKRYSVVTVVDEKGKEVISGRRLENETGEIKSFLGGLDHQEMKVVLEAGQNWYWMCDLLDELGVDNILSHPLKTKAIASAKIKTDKIDSGILAQLCRMDFVPEAYKADIETRHLREMLRYRASVVRMRASVKNRIHALLTKLNIGNPYSDLFGKGGIRYLESLKLAPVYRQALDGHLTILATLNAEIGKADERVDGESADSPEARLLESVPGIGRVLSLTILSEIGDINRFHSAKHLSSFAGLVPSTSQSGGPAKHGRITHQGSAWLRWALCEAAMHVVRYPGPLRDFYLKQKRRKGNKIARVAVARKLATYIYHMLKERKDFVSVVGYIKSDLG